MVEARARRRVVIGGMGRVLVNVGSLEGGVNNSKLSGDAYSTVGLLAVIGTAIDERPDRNALTNGLAVEKPARGWALVAFIADGSGTLTSELKAKFVSVGSIDPAGEGWSRLGSIWSSVILAGGNGLPYGEEGFSFPNVPRGELRGSASKGSPKPWRRNAQEMGSEGPLLSQIGRAHV